MCEADGECSTIIETTSGSTSSTKQLIWYQGDLIEERDGSGSFSKAYFSNGQLNGSTKYFFQTNKLGSVCEMTDNTGALKSEYRFDPFGRRIIVSELIAPDFQFAGYYLHSRSNLYITMTRAYNAELGRWISRDPIEETAGANLYAYVGNCVSRFSDQSGLKPGDPFTRPDDAARDALQFYFARSQNENAEYAGRIYFKGGKFYATTANKGGFNWSIAYVAHSGCTVGDYHTHGNYTTATGQVTDRLHDAQNAEHTGTKDKWGIAGLGARIPGYRAWLATPSRAFLDYDPRTGIETPLGQL